MANYRGHVTGGIAAGALYALVLGRVPIERFAEAAGVLQDWEALAALFVLAVLFALFPDVDTNSKGQNIFIGLAFVTDILLILDGNLQAAAYLGLVAMLPIVGHHRGWTHSKWAMFVVPLPLILAPYIYNDAAVEPIYFVFYGAAVAGYFSHLLLDGLIWRRFRVKNF